MKFNMKNLSFGLVLAGALVFSGNAMADTITGSVWTNAVTYPNNLTVPSGAANITFTLSNATDPFLFSFYSNTDQDLTGFLTDNGANGNTVTYLTGADQNSPTACPALTPCGINNDVMEFTGTANLVNGATYQFTHDDGMNLYIGGTEVITSGAPTAAEVSTFTWTGATGFYSYNLWYDEVNGAPATLSSPDFGMTPEPSSLLLLGTGLFGLALLLQKRKAKPSLQHGLY